MSKIKPEERIRRLALFADQQEDHYEQRVVNGVAYTKYVDGNTGRWHVARYSSLEARDRANRGYANLNISAELDGQLQIQIDKDE